MDPEQPNVIPDPTELPLSPKQSILSHPNPNPITKRPSHNNVLILEKVSNIVAGHYENQRKIGILEGQVQGLIGYNKKLICVLGEFQGQEEKLIKRLRRMQEINIEYMREYCQVKGREFKMPNLPEHKSIFSTLNLQQLDYTQSPNPKPALSPEQTHYKEELLSIFKEFFLTKQDALLANIEEELARGHEEGQARNLREIQRMIGEYHEEMEAGLGDGVFDLLRKRVEIRAKAEEFYDASKNKSEVKPDYEGEASAIDKLISLHSKTEELSQQSLQSFLEQQRSLYKSLEKQRLEYQSILQEKCSSLEELNRKFEEQIKQARMQSDEAVKEIGIKNQETVTAMGKEIQRLKAEITRLGNKPETFDIETQTESYVKIDAEAQTEGHVQQLDGETQTESYVEQLVTQIERSKEIIVKYEQKLEYIKEEYNKEMTAAAQRLKLYEQEIQKNREDRALVENLATQVEQVLSLISSMTTNPAIRKKLDIISSRLKQFLSQYQRDMEWDINKQIPAFFLNLSLESIDARTYRSFELDPEQKIAHSFDLANIPLLQEEVRAHEQRTMKKQRNRSLVIQRPVELSLDLSGDNQEEKDDRDQFENMRRQYHQALECLQMEQKKSKAMEIDYQRYVDIVMNKQKVDPEKYSLEKQLVYLTRLDLQQNETIKQQRKKFNETFKQNLQQFKSKVTDKMNELRSQQPQMVEQKKIHHTIM